MSVPKATQESGKPEAIREAAIAVFAAKGYHDATVSEIAAAAGVGKGTVYFYYASKEDLLLAILEYHYEKMMALIEGIEELAVEPREAVRIVLQDAMCRLRSDPDLFRIMEQQPLLYNERVKQRFEELFRKMVERMAALLQQGVDRSILRPCDTTAAASVLLSTAISFPLYLSLYQGESKDARLSHLSEELGDLIWAALRKPGT